MALMYISGYMQRCFMNTKGTEQDDWAQAAELKG